MSDQTPGVITWSTTGTPEPVGIEFWVDGRPAPKGSKHEGEHGQLREASAYLPAWMANVKKAAFTTYHHHHLDPKTLPLIVGRIGIRIWFHMDPAIAAIDETPDLDKLERGVWDALTGAKVWEDDKRVVSCAAEELEAHPGRSGALIKVWSARRDWNR